MSDESLRVRIAARLEGEGQPARVELVAVHAYSLLVDFPDGVPPDGAQFADLVLPRDDGALRLGRCRFEAHPAGPRRRRDDRPPAPGAGRLLFLDHLYDFSALAKAGRVVDLRQKIEQLPILWSRRDSIRPSFREYVSALVYDIQVYRELFDEIDRAMEGEPPEAKQPIERVACETEYPRFHAFCNDKVRQLEAEVADFSKQEHEQHGFYFRKQLWDIILASPFLARTCLKPRGYSGDSVIMQMIYEQAFRGATIFAKFMHRYPVGVPAAQAVRNRRPLVTGLLRARGDERVRVLSVACGPSMELSDVLLDRGDVERFEFVLLDQDAQALAESQAELEALERRFGARPAARLVRESVRTMLRHPDLAAELGRFDFVYSMGLFDYLTQPVAKAVLARLFELVRPGGELVLGNFHPQNESRIYMEYWGDWVLFYRDEQELLDLARDLPGADCRLSFEETRCQMFLRIRRP